MLGTGLPSFWSIRTGEMRLLLGLSGWTANDWTGASALDQLAPPAEPDADLLLKLGAAFRDHPTLTLDQVLARARTSAPLAAAGLNRLAQMGQVIHDLHAGVYRWRQIMPVAVSLDLIGPDDPETEAARAIVLERRVKVSRNDKRPDGLQVLEGRAGERPVALLLDADGRMLRGKCTCSHHFKSVLRRGPCRHLQALRTATSRGTKAASLDAWYKSLLN
ncbi:MAG TPA: hypothetical protein VGY53_11320 [Isosphaeraceae bacterium]|nr:hypothetical protein [Isosphaeraceae bacterium]